MTIFENIKASILSSSKMKNVVLVAFFLALLGLLLIAIILSRGSQEELAPEFIPFDGPAIMINSENLLAAMKDTTQFELLRTDLKYYARQLIDPYKDGSKEVVFTVNSHQVNDDSFVVVGEYKDQKGAVTFTAARKNYGIIESAIESVFGSSAALKLPSQSDKNKFIGSLPQNTELFRVDYLQKSDSFYVTFSSTITNESIAAARDYLQTKLNDKNLSNYAISAVGFTESGGVKSIDL